MENKYLVHQKPMGYVLVSGYGTNKPWLQEGNFDGYCTSMLVFFFPSYALHT